LTIEIEKIWVFKPRLHELSYSPSLKMYGQASRPISTGQLHTLLRFHLQPIYLVVFQGPSDRCYPVGYPILRGASRLYAFSGYPFRT